jgi:hypothetical protein
MEDYLVTAESVAQTVGLDIDNLPSPFTEDFINQIITDVTNQLQNDLGYPFEEAEFEQTYSSRFLEIGRILRIEYKMLSTVKVEEKPAINMDWREMRENYDYDVDYKKGMIIFHLKRIPRFNLLGGYYNDLRISGEYGIAEEDLSVLVLDYVRLKSAIRLFNSVSAGEFKNVVGYKLGDYQERATSNTTDIKNYTLTLQEQLEDIAGSLGISSSSSMSFKLV